MSNKKEEGDGEREGEQQEEGVVVMAKPPKSTPGGKQTLETSRTRRRSKRGKGAVPPCREVMRRKKNERERNKRKVSWRRLLPSPHPAGSRHRNLQCSHRQARKVASSTRNREHRHVHQDPATTARRQENPSRTHWHSLQQSAFGSQP